MRLAVTDRKWSWIDDGVLPYALAAMRAVWVWTLLQVWAQIILPQRGTLVPIGMVFALLAVSTLFAQLAALRFRAAWLATPLVAGGGLIAVALTLYLAFGTAAFANVGAMILLLIVAAFLWRWGIVSGREPQTYDTYARNFVYGVIGLGSAVFIVYVTHVIPLGTFVVPILVYFGIGLALLAISSLREAQKYERVETNESFTLNRYWLGTVGVVIGTLLIVGFILGLLFAPDAARGLVSILVGLLGFFTRIFLLVAYVIAFLFFGALELVGRVVQFQRTPGEPPQIQPPPRLDELFDLSKQPSTVSPEVYLIFQILAGLLLAAFLFFLFAVAFRRFRHYGEEDVEETRDSVFSMELLRAQLAKLFRRSSKPGAPVAPYVEIRGDDPRAQIRQIYQQWLAWSAARGVTRGAGQTPNEFGEAVLSTLHLNPVPARVITAAYLQARYSDEPIAPNQADLVSQAWQELIQASEDS